MSAASDIDLSRHQWTLEEVRPQTLATPEAFEHDPKLVWEWYDWRRGMVRQAVPNAAACRILGRWTRQRAGFTLITQNVDGLHERAGAKSLIRLHGSIWHVRCWQACHRGPSRLARHDGARSPGCPRPAPTAAALVRPAVVWFGEPLDRDVLRQATEAAARADVFLVIGTSSVVYPAAGLAGHARRHGAFTVELNTEATAISGEVDVSVLGPAAETLVRLDDALGRARP